MRKRPVVKELLEIERGGTKPPERNYMETNIRKRENTVRRQLARQGYWLKKSRARTYTANDQCGYMIVWNNIIQAGERFDLSLEDVERFAKEGL